MKFETKKMGGVVRRREGVVAQSFISKDQDSQDDCIQTIEHGICLKQRTQWLLGALWQVLNESGWEMIEAYIII